MRNAQVLGICLMIVGALFASDAAMQTPVRWWRVGAGVAFIVSGLIGLARTRRAVPPTA